MPLNEVLGEMRDLPGAEAAISGATAIQSRLRVAGRWLLEAHHADRTADAALALGVSLDALVGTKSGLPGSRLSERFALLEPDPSKKEDVEARFRSARELRSAIAHGTNREVGYADLLDLAKQVRWAARRMLALHDRWDPRSESDLDRALNALRWGTSTW